MEAVLESAWLEDDSWLSRYWAGDRQVLEDCYLAHADRVWRGVCEIVGGAEGESVVHEVFFRMISDEAFRRSYTGGNLGAFLVRVGQNLARDQRRQLVRHESLLREDLNASADPRAALHASIEIGAIIDELKSRLEPELHALIELRVVRQLSQAEAAAELGIARTTLAYRDHKLRRTLRAVVLRRGSK